MQKIFLTLLKARIRVINAPYQKSRSTNLYLFALALFLPIITTAVVELEVTIGNQKKSYTFEKNQEHIIVTTNKMDLMAMLGDESQSYPCLMLSHEYKDQKSAPKSLPGFFSLVGLEWEKAFETKCPNQGTFFSCQLFIKKQAERDAQAKDKSSR